MTKTSKQIELRIRRRKNIEDKPKRSPGLVYIRSKKSNNVYQISAEDAQKIVARGSFEYYTKKDWRKYLRNKDKLPITLGKGDRKRRRGYVKGQEGNRFVHTQTILYWPKNEKGEFYKKGDTIETEFTAKVAKFDYKDGKRIFLGIEDKVIKVTKTVKPLRKTIIQYNYSPYICLKIHEVKTAWKKKEEERKKQDELKKKEEQKKKTTTKPKTKKAVTATKEAI